MTDPQEMIAVIMACGFIAFYALPDAVPFVGRLTMMVLTQISVGLVLKDKEKDLNDES